MQDILEILYWIRWLINWSLTFTYTDFAAIGWYLSGVDINYVTQLLITTSTVLLLINWAISVPLVWIVKKVWVWVFNRHNHKYKKIQKEKYLEEFGEWWTQFQKTSVGKIVKRLVEKSRRHPYWALLIANLIPYLPYVSTGTIIAARWWKIRYGIFLILAGNGLKVVIIVRLTYLIGNLIRILFS